MLYQHLSTQDDDDAIEIAMAIVRRDANVSERFLDAAYKARGTLLELPDRVDRRFIPLVQSSPICPLDSHS